MGEQKARCLISKTFDPYFNLAIEDWIYRDLDPSHQVLFLWRNKDSVIIGRNQNPWTECNLKKMEEDKIHLVRRESGGGAVFQDLGNMNFTFLSSMQSYDRQRNYEIVINALKKFNIPAEVRGRNDIIVNGSKVSGSAFKEAIDRAFHHGTLMINVDLEKLSHYLTPSQKKLMAKGIKSVKSRVANLRDFHSAISHETLSEAIIDEFFQVYCAPRQIEVLDHDSLKDLPSLQKYYNLLKSHDWIFGETPQFNHHLEERFSWGSLEIYFEVEKGKITNMKIYSDALDTAFIDSLASCLKGEIYNKDETAKRLSLLREEHPSLKEQIQEFSTWILREIE